MSETFAIVWPAGRGIRHVVREKAPGKTLCGKSVEGATTWYSERWRTAEPASLRRQFTCIPCNRTLDRIIEAITKGSAAR